MVTKSPITSPLGAGERDLTGSVLQGSLADLIDLALIGKQAHWNVIGRQFRSVHLQLDELVAAARGYADDAAERAAAIGVSPNGQARTVADNSGLPKFDNGWKDDHDVVASIVATLDTLVQRLRARIDEVEKADIVTQDLLLEMARKFEEMRWMWQVQLAGAS